MSENRYIVLRTTSPFVPGAEALGAGVRGLADERRTLELTEATLSKAEKDDLRRDPRTRAIAEPMPMRLVEPMETGDPDPGATANDATWGVEAVGAPASPFDGAGVTVAVLDTGIDPGHPAFAGVNLVQKNFTTGGANDQHGHGTHCAGTIFGKDVDGLRIGVARSVQKALIGKVLGPGGGSSATIAHAISWALEEGAHVISMSLGIDFPGFVKDLLDAGMKPEPATSIALEQYRANINLFSELADFVRARGAFAQGTIIVAASGNESERPEFEIAVAPPAAGSGVVSVGALRRDGPALSVAPFSNTQCNVSGPGVQVVSAKRGGGLTAMSGTSMATPHAAGVAALWAQKHLVSDGGVHAETLVARLLGTASTAPLVPGSEVDDVGIGIVQAPAS